MEKKSRAIVQSESLKAFNSNPAKKGTICLSTGTGKTKVAIDFIKEHEEVKMILITSPRTNLKQNWEEELIKWGFEIARHRSDERWSIVCSDGTERRWIWIVMENIQTCYKWEHKHFDLIIADEIHTMMTPEYSQLFQNNTTDWLMGLTATHDVSRNNDKGLFYNRFCPIIYEYYDSADDGLINKTRFIIVNRKLNDLDRIEVKTKTSKFEKGEAEHYKYLTQRIEKGQQLMLAQGSQDWFRDAGDWFWKGNGTKEQKQAAMMYLNAIKYRKDYLLNLPSNILVAKKIKDGILRANSSSKVLIFSELTAQADKITNNTIHSHNTKIENADLLVDFNNGKIRDLGSCQSLTLGLNLKGASHAIMESYIGSATKSKQKKGRLDRLGVDDVAEMWIIRVVGTQADKWFEQMTKDFDLTDAQYVEDEVIFTNKYDYATNTIGK